jgi:hypothetical protein
MYFYYKFWKSCVSGQKAVAVFVTHCLYHDGAICYLIYKSRGSVVVSVLVECFQQIVLINLFFFGTWGLGCCQ